MSALVSKRLLQGTVAVLALIPIAVGGVGALTGPGFLMTGTAWPVDLDSHFRYLSGVFLAVGLIFYGCIPAIERKTALFRLAALPIVVGGLARLGSLLAAGTPTTPHMFGLVLELGVVPALVVWQTSVAYRTPAFGWRRTTVLGN